MIESKRPALRTEKAAVRSGNIGGRVCVAGYHRPCLQELPLVYAVRSGNDTAVRSRPVKFTEEDALPARKPQLTVNQCDGFTYFASALLFPGCHTAVIDTFVFGDHLGTKQQDDGREFKTQQNDDDGGK